MNLLYIHQYFKTPQEGGCVRSYHLAKGLVKLGHEVTMITAHDEFSKEQEIDGIHVHYLQIRYANGFGFLRRLWAYYSFVRKSQKKIAQLQLKFDLAYVMTTPLTTGIIALRLKKRYNLPFIFEVGDLWPDAPIKMGAIKSRLLSSMLYRFEKKCYFEAQKVVALSPAIRNYIESSRINTKVHVIPNFSDIDFFEPNHKFQYFDKANPLKVGYFGTFGAANELSSLVKIANLAEKNQCPVHFTLMGDGAQFQKVKGATRNLENITILPFGNSFKVKKQLEQQDAVYVSFKKLEILNTGSPNKFFDGLAAGKMTILNFGGWVRNLVDKHQCGFYHDPDRPEDFIRKLEVFIKKPELLRTYQQNARILAEKYYRKDLQVEKLSKILANDQYLNISDSEVYILTA